MSCKLENSSLAFPSPPHCHTHMQTSSAYFLNKFFYIHFLAVIWFSMFLWIQKFDSSLSHPPPHNLPHPFQSYLKP